MHWALFHVRALILIVSMYICGDTHLPLLYLLEREGAVQWPWTLSKPILISSFTLHSFHILLWQWRETHFKWVRAHSVWACVAWFQGSGIAFSVFRMASEHNHNWDLFATKTGPKRAHEGPLRRGNHVKSGEIYCGGVPLAPYSVLNKRTSVGPVKQLFWAGALLCVGVFMLPVLAVHHCVYSL